MKKETKKTISEKELSKIRSLNEESQKLQMELGATELQIEMMKQKKQMIFQAVSESRAKVQSILKEIEEEFGKGSIDINTGEFVPAEQPAQE